MSGDNTGLPHAVPENPDGPSCTTLSPNPETFEVDRTGTDADSGGRSVPLSPDLVALHDLVDLVDDPDGEALALWYAEHINAGSIVVHGADPSPSLFSAFRPLERIPPEAWRDLTVEWACCVALPKEYHDIVPLVRPAWRRLHIARADVLADPAVARDAAAGARLLITFVTAWMLAQWWRERATLPADWWLPVEEWWSAKPELRPDVMETSGWLGDCVRDGSLATYMLGYDGSMATPPSVTWEAASDRVDPSAGLVNLGVNWDVAAYDPELAETLRPRWATAYVEFCAVRQRYRETWGRLYEHVHTGDSPAEHRDSPDWYTYAEVVARYLADCREPGRAWPVPNDAWGWLRASSAVRHRRLRISGPAPSRMMVAAALTGDRPQDAAISPELLKALKDVRFSKEDVERLLSPSAAFRGVAVERPTAEEPGLTGRKGMGGPPRKYPWDALGAAFGAWLHEQPGRAELKNKAHQDALAELARHLGCRPPERSSAQPYIRLWLEGYRAFLASLDAEG